MINVILVTYNGKRWIEKCIGSLQNQPLVSDILVIDNGSTDGTIEYVQDRFPKVNLVINQRNHGFGYSNNQGLEITISDGCEYAFLLNQDAWIEADTLSTLVHAHQEHSEYGILSPMHLRGDGKMLDMKFATFVAQSENYKLISDLYLHGDQLATVYAVPFVNAAAWLVTRECFMNVGGFASVYHHYGEDMDYANRVLYHGFKIGICPACIVHHDRKNVIELPNINRSHRYLELKRIWHLIYLTDIRHSFLFRYFKLLVIAIGNCVMSVGGLRTKNAITYFKEWIILLKLGPKVYLNNRITKKRGPAFLDRVSA